MVESIAGQDFLLVWRIQLAALAKQAGGVDRRGADEAAAAKRMGIMKDLIKKIRSKERMDAQNRWWIAEFLAF